MLICWLRSRSSCCSPCHWKSVVVALAVCTSGARGEAEHDATSNRGMVVSVSAPASQVGAAILRRGGNAVDAAVATAFALAVTHPAAGNIGGGGFMLIAPPHENPIVVDYRETAPAAATRDMFAQQQSPYGHRVVGVPGTVRGLAMAHARFGKMPWRDLLEPAIELATNGFPLEPWTARSLNELVRTSQDFPELVRVFGKDEGRGTWSPGDRFCQPDLARTLRCLAEEGPNAFYIGKIAERIIAEMKSGGGLITAADLRDYTAKWRQPIHGTYRGYDVYGAPPPSSGGVCLVQMLNMLEKFDLKAQGRFSSHTLHCMAEVMRRAYLDRARYLGDPDFVRIPEHLISRDHAARWVKSIRLDKATPSADLAPEIVLAPEGNETTHFSIIDANGLAVSNTYTLEYSYGSRVVVRGAGFLLNNEMGDFNWFPGKTDRKGRIGTDANLIAPKKRMLSSQCPTILRRDGETVLITGSPGGRTIINTVLCIVINVVDFGMTIREAIDAPRMHHQWFPDRIELEAHGLVNEVIPALKQLGHEVIVRRQGDAHSIFVDTRRKLFIGAADRRIMGSAKAP